MSVRPYVDHDPCIACGVCRDVCPADPNCFEIKEKSEVVHPESCIGCRTCETNCPVSCITVKE